MHGLPIKGISALTVSSTKCPSTSPTWDAISNATYEHYSYSRYNDFATEIFLRLGKLRKKFTAVAEAGTSPANGVHATTTSLKLRRKLRKVSPYRSKVQGATRLS